MAEYQSSNFRLYGCKYGLLEDQGMLSDPSRVPYLYTHNVHFGSILFTLAEALGAHSLWVKQFLTLFGFILGLTYIYRCSNYLSNRSYVGICVLFLFITDYANVLAFGLNALRAWHWLGLFGLSFHVWRYCTERNFINLDRAGIFLCTLVSFCVGYEFLGICFFINTLLIAFSSGKISRRASCFGWLVFSILTLFALRQLQVISVLGFHFWFTDFLYSVSIKITFLSNYIQIPSPKEMNEFYQHYNVLRPGASPAPLSQLWLGFIRLLKSVTFPTAGIGSFLSLIILACFSLVLMFSSIFFKKTNFYNSYSSLNNYCKFYISLILGSCFGIFFFGGLSISIYLKHEFPLLIAPFLFAKGLLLALFLETILKRYKKRTAASFAIVCFLILLDHGVTQLSNVHSIKPMSVSWIPFVKEHPEASFAVSWNRLSIAPFNKNWSIGLKPGTELEILKRLKQNETLFKMEDIIDSDQQDSRPKEGINFLQPDFWVYFPFEARTNLKRSWPWKRLGKILKNEQPIKNEFIPEIEKALTSNSNIKIVSRGEEYIILDLRELWNKQKN